MKCEGNCTQLQSFDKLAEESPNLEEEFESRKKECLETCSVGPFVVSLAVGNRMFSTNFCRSAMFNASSREILTQGLDFVRRSLIQIEGEANGR